MIHFPPWKVYGIIGFCLLSLFFASPNLMTKETLSKLPSWLPQTQFNLGLDLQGGSQILLEVDFKEGMAKSGLK